MSRKRKNQTIFTNLESKIRRFVH